MCEREREGGGDRERESGEEDKLMLRPLDMIIIKPI